MVMEMDFESPDVEREFPGLYASESGKRSQESDFSDEAHERPSKKDLLIGKRKEKKESKKDQGYAALEGESSPEDDVDMKSPSKSKKSKSFKFPTIKEKREKSREKDLKEKEKDRERDAEEEKDKKKDHKSKLKLKDKKKSKHAEDGVENIDDMPIFGVPLAIAVDRNHCHDGVAIPVIVRDCIDYVQEYGLCVEGIYKVSGVKSKIQQLKRSYNRRENVNLADFDLYTTTSLLKTFLRELPESILTPDLASKFEEAAGIKELTTKEEILANLVAQLPRCNHTCLTWIMRHFDNVVTHERQNKMGVSTLSATMSPSLQMSSRLTSTLLSSCRTLFPDVKLIRYIPPLCTTCTQLPDSCETISTELAKQESLLSQIHSEMNYGYTVRTEQLWEVQRFITQLKRKMKILEKAQESSLQTHEENQPTSTISSGGLEPGLITQTKHKLNIAEKTHESSSQSHEDNQPTCTISSAGHMPLACSSASEDAVKNAVGTVSLDLCQKSNTACDTEGTTSFNVLKVTNKTDDEVAEAVSSALHEKDPFQTDSSAYDVKYYSGVNGRENPLFLEFEQKLLVQYISDLKSRIYQERETIEALHKEILALQSCPPGNSSCSANHISCNTTSTEQSNYSVPVKALFEHENKEIEKLYKKTTQLMEGRSSLIQQVINERQACIQLRIELELLHLRDV